MLTTLSALVCETTIKLDNMPDNAIRIIKNSKHSPCKRCGGVHVYITRLSPDADCETPVAFSHSKALTTARLFANGAEDVVRVPDDTLVIMDDSARRLPRAEGPGLKLAQFTLTERYA